MGVKQNEEGSAFLPGCYALTVAPGGQLQNCFWDMTKENAKR